MNSASKQQLTKFVKLFDTKISELKPSEWTEENLVLTTDVSPFPGPFRYDKTPYTREIIDCFSPDHPSKVIAIMKGAQLGFSSGFVYPAIGFIIANNPGPILFTAGSDELVRSAVETKIDQMIDSCNISSLIRPNSRRTRRTADTSKQKEFIGGYLMARSIQTLKDMRQTSFQYGFLDDYEMSSSTNERNDGDALSVIMQRFNAYGSKMKLALISTPMLKDTSKIEPAFMQGDQRYFFVPCPLCGDFIKLVWFETNDKGQKVGVTFDKDDNGKLIKDSVGYTCQSCGGFFKEKHKIEMLERGEWRATAKPQKDGYYSYHINALYAPAGMFSWTNYAEQWVSIFPENGVVNRGKLQSFNNLVLGLTFEDRKKETSITQIARNCRDYQCGVVPFSLSIQDGNGEIVLITMACDLNGLDDDARIDWEILAHSESGATYSVNHGSIGTFQRRKSKEERNVMSYYFSADNSVWDELTKIIQTPLISDEGKHVKIMYTGIDTGSFTQFAYKFIDEMGANIIGIKGEDDLKVRKLAADTPYFKQSSERNNLFLVYANKIKDDIAEYMALKWNKNYNQPPGFMNYPLSSDGKYQINGYFEEYEGEHRKPELNADGSIIGFSWQKKSNSSKNHFWDCRVYNIALRYIYVKKIFEGTKIKNPSWKEYCSLMK